MSKGCAGCESCGVRRTSGDKFQSLDLGKADFLVALAGNPNTGKSTVFNALTGLRQHTGNWPGKTVTRAEGLVDCGGKSFKLVDLPGTYSLLARSVDEEIARDFLLFGQPDVTIVVLDATRLERNLNLALQVLEITDRVVICLNLMDEARRLGIELNPRQLARDLGVPVVATAARQREGLKDLQQAVLEVASGRFKGSAPRLQNEPTELREAISQLSTSILGVYPHLPNARWVALQLLDGDERVLGAVREGELGSLTRNLEETETRPEEKSQPGSKEAPSHDAGARAILAQAEELRWQLGSEFHDRLVEAIYAEATRLAERVTVAAEGKKRFSWEREVDRLVTSRLWGFPLMFLLFAFIFWLTIEGANVPSALLADVLVDTLYPWLREGAFKLGLPWWLGGVLIDGVYLATAWVVSVMLPPMAIFFPLFTLLEDLGYLPRVAFNLDGLFKRSGAHGKQALSMMMGYGCNAAGIVATRIIDSPRERLIAILTNNFSLCNGRWPTQILIASLFIGPLAPAAFGGFFSAGAVVGVALLGVGLTFLVSWGLSRTILKGEVSTFSLELPPYRPPRVLQTIYTSLIDRTLFVLFRAVVFAAPAGAVIWLISNVHLGSLTVAEHAVQALEPLGWFLGLNGVILLAYVVAIPANEIVVPTVLMLTVLTARIAGHGSGAGVMFEAEAAGTQQILVAGGWSLLTAMNLMLFSLLHNPCSTTIFTIWKETRSLKWTSVATLLPVVLGVLVCATTAALWRWF